MGILSCVFVIIGAIVGAGFASGREIYTFFFVHGKYGIIGIAISVCLIGIAIYKTLKKIKKYNIENYEEFLEIIIGDIGTKNIKIKIVINFIINIFLLITFFVMCAGVSAYFEQELRINQIITGIAVSVFCLIFLNKDMKGVVILNFILIPLIIIVLLILGIKAFDPNIILEETDKSNLWIVNSILYASYNSITLVSLLIPMKKYITNKKDILKVAFLCAIIMIILSGIIFMLLLSINGDISKIELPTVYSAGNFGIIYKYLYGIIILGAIITTAISSAYSFLNNVSRTKKRYRINNIIICIIAIFMSTFGFANLVNKLYPVFGILGLIQLGLVLKPKMLYNRKKASGG